MPKTMTLQDILEELFDDIFELGGDIVLERQFENDPEYYKRYRARVIKPLIDKIEGAVEDLKTNLGVKNG